MKYIKSKSNQLYFMRVAINSMSSNEILVKYPFYIAYLSSNTKKSKGVAVGAGGQGKNSCEGIFMQNPY